MNSKARFCYPPVTNEVVKSGCYLTSMGHASYRPYASYPAAGHPQAYRFNSGVGRVFPDFGLVFITAGEGVFATEGRQVQKVRAGDVFCLLPGCWHRYSPNEETGWEEFWICVNGDYPHRLQRSGELPDAPTVLHLADPHPFQNRLEVILKEMEKEVNNVTLSLGLRALALITELFGKKTIASAQAEPVAVQKICAQAKRFIEENSHRMIVVESLADHLGVTRRTLERQFRREIGMSPGEYIIHCRVQRAKTLIESTTMSLKAIAYSCGFSSPQQMIYSFRQQTGLSPVQFRKS